MLKKLRQLITPPTTEQRTVNLDGTQVTYTLNRTNRRRSIGLRIDNHGLTVNMPLRASEKWLQDVLQNKAHWVVKKLETWQTNKPVSPQWRDGQSLFFMGELITLRVIVSLFAMPPLLKDSQLFVHVTQDTNETLIEQIVTQWYQHEAKKLFQECVEHFAPLMNVTPRIMKISSARTQWGSCTTRGDVRLNWQLIKLPLHLIDYVVVHELAHLIEMNHSAAFWQVVKNACPDYAKRRRELRQWQISPS
jgi:predicted metal-dependent hydrolase